MFPPQHNRKPTGSLSRGKSTRRFGQDLTNYNFGVQTKTPNQQSYVSISKITLVNNYIDSMEKYYPVCSELNLMVDEISRNPLDDHINDIMEYTLSSSFATCIEEDYMRWHSEINKEMREILINWLIRLQVQLKLQQTTLCLAVSLLDKYCYQQSILKSKYQLLGLTCMFMAAKYEELATPRIQKFLEQSDGIFKKRELIDMESDILCTVGFNLNKLMGLRELLFSRVDDIFRSYKASQIGDMVDED